MSDTVGEEIQPFIPKFVYCKIRINSLYTTCQVEEFTDLPQLTDDSERNDWATLGLLCVILLGLLTKGTMDWCKNISCTKVEDRGTQQRQQQDPAPRRQRRPIPMRRQHADIEMPPIPSAPHRTPRTVDCLENYYVENEFQ